MQNVRDVYSIEIENVFFLFSPQGEPIVTLEEKVESIYKQRRNKLKVYIKMHNLTYSTFLNLQLRK